MFHDICTVLYSNIYLVPTVPTIVLASGGYSSKPKTQSLCNLNIKSDVSVCLKKIYIYEVNKESSF